MRLFLLPISTRRTLIYCQRTNVAAREKQTWIDWGTSKATKLWADWEKRETGWQKKVVDYGNHALKRIPYEEWGLKSIPPISARKKGGEISDGEKVEVFFPSTVLPEGSILEVLKKLGTERQGLHQKRLVWSLIGMPISAPFAIVPVVPNLPFFYLVFRAWSHWRALSGSKHIEHLLQKKLITPKPSMILDLIYANEKRPFETASETQISQTLNLDETMIIHKPEAKRIAEALSMPELDIELDRAIWQVDKSIQAEKKAKAGKILEKAQPKEGEKKE